MRLGPGSTLGVYTITAHIGQGGMGEVYRAHDARLDRDVAIKVLPALFVADLERVARFEREARTLASLNDPHIAQIYGIEDAGGGVTALVLELVEGPTLADRLTTGPLPLPQTLAIAIQVAEALEAAHEKGIVHRDLKPANIKVTPAGVVKVLDFGIAKVAADADAAGTPAESPTVTRGQTGDGVSLGTAAYMSPEQARGQTVDPRTDIWAFGCVLYEMLVGRSPFARTTIVDTLAAILDREPAWDALPTHTPPSIRRLLRRCLDKDVKRRLRHVADAALDLEDARGESGRTHLEAPIGPRDSSTTDPRPRQVRRPLWFAWSAAAVGLLIGAAVTAAMLSTRRSTLAVSKMTFEVDIPSAVVTNSMAPTLTISPDGQQLAVMVFSPLGPELRIRPLNGLETSPLFHVANNVTGAAFPFWSPDSRMVAFFANKKLQKIDISGNPPQTICETEDGRGGTWNRSGVILFAPSTNGPLFQVAEAGGRPRQVTELDADQHEIAHREPNFLPDGRHFLFLAVSSQAGSSAIYVGSLDSKLRKRLFPSTFKARFAAPDHILFLREATLMAQAFDVQKLEMRGEPFRVAEQIATGNSSNAVAAFDVSDQGTLAYRTAKSTERHLLWFDRAGTQLGEVAAPSRTYTDPALSPGVDQLAVANQGDVWLVDLARGGSSRFTFDPGDDGSPLWSRDGSRIAFNSSRAGKDYDLYLKDAAGNRPEELLIASDRGKWPEDWSPDDHFLLFTETTPDGRLDLWTMAVTGDRKPHAVVQSLFISAHGRFSRDGRWIAYASNMSGRAEIYVQRFPVAENSIEVSMNGGAQPRWRSDGKELFFLSLTGEAMAVDVAARTNTIEFGQPHRLFQANPTSVFSGRNAWDVTPDGQRFLITSGGAAPPVTLIVNWN